MTGYSLSSESTPIILHSRVHSACLPLPKAALSAPPSPTRPRLLTRHRNQLHRLHAAFAPSNQRLQLDLDRFSSTSASMSLHEEQSTLGEESGLLKSTAEELYDESDFEKIVSPEGYISICGFGSLLSERSARSTFPDLINFRLARLRGFRRVFAHAAPVFFERGIAKPETKEISSLSVEPCDCETLIVTVFEIQKSEIPSFMKREPEFRFLAVFPETLDGKLHPNPAVLCARYSDEEFYHIRCKGDKDLYYQLYGKYNIHKIWRDDIFPCRTYLRHCVLAAKNLGEEALNNFLDHTYLGDRKTTIREYLATAGSGIMEEEPPESLKTRYVGNGPMQTRLGHLMMEISVKQSSNHYENAAMSKYGVNPSLRQWHDLTLGLALPHLILLAKSNPSSQDVTPNVLILSQSSPKVILMEPDLSSWSKYTLLYHTAFGFQK